MSAGIASPNLAPRLTSVRSNLCGAEGRCRNRTKIEGPNGISLGDSCRDAAGAAHTIIVRGRKVRRSTRGKLNDRVNRKTEDRRQVLYRQRRGSRNRQDVCWHAAVPEIDLVDGCLRGKRVRSGRKARDATS